MFVFAILFFGIMTDAGMLDPIIDRYIAQSPDMAAYFLNADGTPKAIGTLLKNPALAAVLERIAKEGPDALYHGPIADEIARKVPRICAMAIPPDDGGGIPQTFHCL